MIPSNYSLDRQASKRARASMFEYDICKVDETTKVEIELTHGYCMSRVRNMTKEVYHSVDEKFILEKINDEMPELLTAADRVTICGMSLPKIIELANES